MANHFSALKRARQTETRTATNRANSARLRTALRTLRETIEKGDKQAAEKTYRLTVSKGDYPRQGDDSHRHTMDIRRGPAGFGVTAVKCSTCHQDHNLWDAHLPPGAPAWHLPSPDMPMIWEGLTDGQLCQSIKDPKQNKGRNLNQLVEHLTEDKLVAWGWNPGIGRTPVPIAHDEFSAKVKAWQAAGAPWPAR